MKKIIIHEYLNNIYLDEEEQIVYRLINFKNLLKNKIRKICDENNKYYISLCGYDHHIVIDDKELMNLTSNVIHFGIKTNDNIKNNKYDVNEIKSFTVMLTLYMEKDFLKFKNDTENYYGMYESYLEAIFENYLFFLRQKAAYIAHVEIL